MLPGDEASRHDGTEAGDQEGAVDRQPDDGFGLVARRPGGRARLADERRLQRVEALPAARRNGNDRSVLEKGAAHELAHVRRP